MEFESLNPSEVKRPEWHLYHPDWFHSHGNRMRLESQLNNPPGLIIKATAAELVISHVWNRVAPWSVYWNIKHSQDEFARGTVIMPEDILEAAFGLKDNLVTKDSRWMIERFGGTSSAQRYFIRYENFLNIPCPGTGHDGDPNISIGLDDEIKAAVKGLIEAKPRAVTIRPRRRLVVS